MALKVKKPSESLLWTKNRLAESIEPEINNKAAKDEDTSCWPGKLTVLLDWIIRPLPDIRGVCVEGHKQGVENFWHSTAIVEAVAPKLVVTTTGSQYQLKGNINKLCTLDNGFSKSVANAFARGFPKNWKHIIEEFYNQLEDSICVKENRCPVNMTRKASKLVSEGKRRNSQVKVQPTPAESDSILTAHGIIKKKLSTGDITVTRSGRMSLPPLAAWTGQHYMTIPGTDEIEVTFQTDCAKNTLNQSTTQVLQLPKKSQRMMMGNKMFSKSFLLSANSTGKASKQRANKTFDCLESMSATTAANKTHTTAADKTQTTAADKTQTTAADKTQTTAATHSSPLAAAQALSASVAHNDRSRFALVKQAAGPRAKTRTTGATVALSSANTTTKSSRLPASTSRCSKGQRSRSQISTSSPPVEGDKQQHTEMKCKKQKVLSPPVEGDKQQHTEMKCKKQKVLSAPVEGDKQQHTEMKYEKQKVLSPPVEGDKQQHTEMKCKKQKVLSPPVEGDKQQQTAMKCKKQKVLSAPIKAKLQSQRGRKRKETDDYIEAVVDESSGSGENVRPGKRSSPSQPSSHKQGAWSHTEKELLQRALTQVNGGRQDYWKQVSELVGTRSHTACQQFYTKLMAKQTSSKPTTLAKSSQNNGRQKGAPIRGGRGTLKRKQDLRDFLAEQNVGHEDNLFDSTPFASRTRTTSVFAVNLNQNDSSIFGINHSCITPGGLNCTPGTLPRPKMASVRKTPAQVSQLRFEDTPLSINRRKVDQYIKTFLDRRNKAGAGQSEEQGNLSVLEVSALPVKSLFCPDDLPSIILDDEHNDGGGGDHSDGGGDDNPYMYYWDDDS